MLSFSFIVGLFLLLCGWSHAYYVPGVNMQSFQQGEEVLLKVNAITSIHTQVPRDYYNLAVCKPPQGVVSASQNWGQFLAGSKIQSSPYSIFMLQEAYCQQLCQEITLNKIETETMSSYIKHRYHNNWIIDNLPSASQGIGLNGELRRHYAGGFPIGFIAADTKQAYVYNHINILIDYHSNLDGGFNVVGFSVEPLSIRHKKQIGISLDGKHQSLSTCSTTTHLQRENIDENQIVAEGEPIIYTYDVIWSLSDVEWANRWNVYLTEDHLVPAQVHWYSIFNSVFIALLLATVIGVVLVRNVRSDLSDPDCTNEIVRSEELEEKGWKRVHVNIIRPPRFAPRLLAVCCGTGAQILSTVLVTIFYAMLGFLSPAKRGNFIIFMLMVFTLAGFVNGYVTARIFKAFKGENWQSAVQLCVLFFPAITYHAFLLRQLLFWFASSTCASPFYTLIIVTALCPVSAILVYFGALVGYNQSTIHLPEGPSSVVLGNILNRHKLSKLSWRY